MDGELMWERSLSSALERAKSEKKSVLIDFYGPS